MNIVIKKSFSKDINKIRNKALLNLVSKTIKYLQSAKSTREIKPLKKLQGSSKHYRIRIGDYRIGLLIEKDTIYIVRFLHRKDIYRFFP